MTLDDDTELAFENYDDLLFELRHRGLNSSYDKHDAEYACSRLLDMIEAAPKSLWTDDRIAGTLSVLYDVASEATDERDWSIYDLLGGNAPAKLLKTHLKNLEETFGTACKQQNYYHFVHHPALIRELQSWRRGKRHKPLDSTSWKAALHHHYTNIDWSQAEDPVATLLALRAAQPYADIETQRGWWLSMLAHDTRFQWQGSLRHSTLVAALEDSAFLNTEVLDKYLAKCLVDLDFIERLPDLDTNVDIYERKRTLGQMETFWLQLRIRRLDLVEPIEGEDIELRKRKRHLVDSYNKAFSKNTNAQSLITCLALVFKQNSSVETALETGMQAAWSTLLSLNVSTKEKDTLQLVFDDINSLEVARHYVENVNVTQHSSTAGLPDDLIQDFVFPGV